MQTKTRHPGDGKEKYWGDKGIDIPVLGADEAYEVVPDAVQAWFERGLFIAFNARCRELRKRVGAEKLREHVEDIVGQAVKDPDVFYQWMATSVPRRARTTSVTMPEKDSYTKEELEALLKAQGINIKTV